MATNNRNVDVTVRGKNQSGKAFQDARSDVKKFEQGISSALNPLRLFKAGLAALGLASFGALLRNATSKAIENEKAVGGNARAVTALSTAWNDWQIKLGRAILGFDQGAERIDGLTQMLVGLGRWIDDNRDSIDLLSGSVATLVGWLGQLTAWSVDHSGLKAIRDTAQALAELLPGSSTEEDETAQLNGRELIAYSRAMAAIRKRRRQEAERIKAIARNKELEPASESNRGRLDGLGFKVSNSGGMPRIGITSGQSGGEIGLGPADPSRATSSVMVADAISQGHALKAAEGIETLGDSLDNVAQGSILNFAETWSEAIGSIVTGSENAGKAIAKAFRKATGSALVAEGQKWMLEAAAIAIKGFYNPVDYGRAAALFAKGTAAIALGSALAGGGGGGGAGSSSNLGAGAMGAQQRESIDGQGETRIIVIGDPYLNMADPRIRDSFVDAFQAARASRQIVIEYQPGEKR